MIDMVQRGCAAGADLIFKIFVRDSAQVDGRGKGSLAYSAFSVRYQRNGETLSGAITPQDIATIGTYVEPTANTNIRIKEIDGTNALGEYEVQIHHDWVNATNNCRRLAISFAAAGAAPCKLLILLTGANLQDGVRGGMTALPNAAAGADGGLLKCTVGNVLPPDSINDLSFDADVTGPEELRDMIFAKTGLGALDPNTFGKLFAEMAIVINGLILSRKTFTVLADAGNSPTQIKTDLPGGLDHYKNQMVMLTSGAMSGQSGKKVSGNTAGPNAILMFGADDDFSGTPAADVTGVLLDR